MLSSDARLTELRGNVLGMLDRDGKGDGANALGVTMPMLDQVADETLAVDGIGKSTLVVISPPRFHRGEVRQELLGHGEDARLDEVTLGDELAGRGHDEQVVKGVAQSLAVGAERGSGEPKMNRTRVEGRDIFIGLRCRAVAIMS